MSGHVCDEVVVLVDVQNGELGKLGGSCDEEVGDGGRTVLTSVGERGSDLGITFTRQCPSEVLGSRETDPLGLDADGGDDILRDVWLPVFSATR